MLPLAPMLVPLVTALLAAALPRHARLRRGASLAGAVALLVCAAALFVRVSRGGAISVAVGDWPLPYAIEFVADGLAAALVLTAALLGVCAVVHALATGPASEERAGLHPLLHALLAAVMAVFLAGDLFNLYVWFELMLIATLGLLVLGAEQRHAEAALKYFAVSMLGTLLMLAAVGLIYGATGHLNLAALGAAALAPQVAAALPAPVTLLLLALLLKAGVFPLFLWLPASYHALPVTALALIGGLLTKVALYVVLRLLGGVFVNVPGLLVEALGWLAVITMISGVLGAAYHWDMRRILAFHIVSQIGYLLLGVALASPAGTAGTAFFLIHNVLVKAQLFLVCGLMWMAAGHHDLRRIGGLYAARPLLALLFLIGAFSLVGVPPSSGFWGKLLLVREAFAQDRLAWGGAALGVGLLTLYSMSKIWLEGFWKPHPETRPQRSFAHAALSPVAYLAALALTLPILALGLYPEPAMRHLELATQALWSAGGQR
ncbi:MAG: Na+/H+ antiporter subunit D [Betaproteobacteria bacterium]|nr:MAG: Na+/H+ antiporter subunit D [Betaproteobacteria bacterium]